MNRTAIGLCICLATLSMMGCGKRDDGQWKAKVEAIMGGGDVIVTSVVVVCQRPARLDITENGEVRDGVQLVMAKDGRYEGRLVICGDRCPENERPWKAQVWYQLESGGVRSLSTDMVELQAQQKVPDVVKVNVADGSYRIGSGTSLVLLGERKLSLSVR